MHRERPAADRTLAALPLRLIYTVVEESFAAGSTPVRPGRRIAVSAVIANPLAGQYEEDLAELVELGAALGRYLSERVRRAVEGEGVAAVGKAVVVGQDGELEHGAAVVGPGFDAAVRRAIGEWRLERPSVKKLAGPGASAEVVLSPLEGSNPLAGPNPSAGSNRAGESSLEVRVPGHPRDDEMVVTLAAAEVAP